MMKKKYLAVVALSNLDLVGAPWYLDILRRMIGKKKPNRTAIVAGRTPETIENYLLSSVNLDLDIDCKSSKYQNENLQSNLQMHLMIANPSRKPHKQSKKPNWPKQKRTITMPGSVFLSHHYPFLLKL